MMSTRTSIPPSIIERLYREAINLAEDARSTFEYSHTEQNPARQNTSDVQRIALSCEALRTTTRMMHVLAWLLNHRAFFAGELSEFQLRRHGRLPTSQPPSDPAQLALLDAETADVVERSSAFYARIERLDHDWRAQYIARPQAVERLRDRLGAAFAANQG